MMGSFRAAASLHSRPDGVRSHREATKKSATAPAARNRMLSRRKPAVRITTIVSRGNSALKSAKKSWNFGMTTVIRIAIRHEESAIRIAG